MSVKLIVLDVEGTLTNGDIIVDSNGNELKKFNAKDGLAISTWTKRLGMDLAVITGRESSCVSSRAEELGVQHIHQNVSDKLAKVEEICAKLGISLEEVAAIGDDLNDYKMLSAVGMSFCPNDASSEILKLVKTVLMNDGGCGAVREMIEHVCLFGDRKKEFLQHYKG